MAGRHNAPSARVLGRRELFARSDHDLFARQAGQDREGHFEFMAASNAPGVSVAVVQNGEFVWSGGFGMADLENSVPATADTLYRLGSVSKPITATAALVLSERGQLDLDAPIQKCPAFPRSRGPSRPASSWGIWGNSLLPRS